MTILRCLCIAHLLSSTYYLSSPCHGVHNFLDFNFQFSFLIFQYFPMKPESSRVENLVLPTPNAEYVQKEPAGELSPEHRAHLIALHGTIGLDPFLALVTPIHITGRTGS